MTPQTLLTRPILFALPPPLGPFGRADAGLSRAGDTAAAPQTANDLRGNDAVAQRLVLLQEPPTITVNREFVKIYTRKKKMADFSALEETNQAE